MKKQRIILGGTFIVTASLLLSSCSTADEESKEVPTINQQEQVQTEPEPEVEFRDDTSTNESSSFMLSEYSSFKAFMKSIKEDVAEGSDYRQRHDTIVHLTSAVYSYSEYFEYEINEMGLQQDFVELNDIGKLVEQSSHAGSAYYDQYVDEFINKVNEIAPKVENGEELSGAINRLGKWASMKVEYLSNPLNNHEFVQAKYDEGLEYHIKASEISADIPKRAATEDEELAETISKITELARSVMSQQYARTENIEVEGIGPQDIQYADQWKPVSENMRNTYKELEQVINDLDKKLNS